MRGAWISGNSFGPVLKSVEILVFGVHENPLLLREVHMINKTILITFLDRRNSENI